MPRVKSGEPKACFEITKAIRKAKAETLFGIGVKLSVSEHFEDFDVVEAAEDARRAVAQLTGYNFIAATSRLGEEMQPATYRPRFILCWLLLSISESAIALAEAIAPEEVKRMRRR